MLQSRLERRDQQLEQTKRQLQHIQRELDSADAKLKRQQQIDSSGAAVRPIQRGNGGSSGSGHARSCRVGPNAADRTRARAARSLLELQRANGGHGARRARVPLCGGTGSPCSMLLSTASTPLSPPGGGNGTPTRVITAPSSGSERLLKIHAA
ncbi:uncharacterized protein IUM83_00915 [Phytophthora cinnamomi]|uniref:uncharacterized protein n=1 Tax=Phytophthora cinnamomi TaxID=4785 RepID=UPI003559D935|nr:hypothetical protein IUM83_00915 [Phytophthora cinnamomi]